MFQKNKKTSYAKILAPMSGIAVPLSEVSDETFSSGTIGKGIALRPEDNIIYSPVDGTVNGVSDSHHAISITSDKGADILIHIGIDTVELCGQGIDPKVEAGQKIKAGDIIAKADFNFIKSKGYDISTPVIISNTEEIKYIKLFTGNVSGGTDTVIEYM